MSLYLGSNYRMMPNKLVLALSYYNTPLMLAEHIKTWEQYPDELVEKIKIILVDDGSMTHPAEKELKLFNLKVTVELYRITKDIPQNIYGVRNLAFHIASVEGAKWVMCTDLDHVLPSRGLDGFHEVKGGLTSDNYYSPYRYGKDRNGIYPMSRHLDTYVMSPELFWKTGGYDEDLTGYYYNGAALYFRKKLNQISLGVPLPKVYTIFYSSDIVSDASPLSSVEKKVFTGEYSEKKKPSVLNFEWERVL